MALMDRYWIASVPRLWSDPTGWSAIPAGPGGATPPDQTSAAIFSFPSASQCSVASSVLVGALRMAPGYDGTIVQQAPIHVLLDTALNGGRFDASTTLRADGPLQLGNTQFNTGDSTLEVRGLPSYFNTTRYNGSVILYGGCDASSPNASFLDLQIRDSSSRPTIVRGTWDTDEITLFSGNLRRGAVDATMHLRGDLICLSNYGSWTADNTMMLRMDGSGLQQIWCDPTAVVPALYVDKSTSDQVLCSGEGPLNINGDFYLKDGTVNLNGIDLVVGAA